MEKKPEKTRFLSTFQNLFEQRTLVMSNQSQNIHFI